VGSYEENEKGALFRFGLIGAGRMGRTHLRAFAGSELVAVTAIAEVSEQARRAVAGSPAVVYPTIEEMLDRAALDGILITAPSDQHARIVGDVTARGLPVLCEKPCGGNRRAGPHRGRGRGGGAGTVPGRVLAALRPGAAGAAGPDRRR